MPRVKSVSHGDKEKKTGAMTGEAHKGEAAESPEDAVCQKPGNRVLIVDDEKTIRELFLRILSYNLPDCRIDVAVNGVEAVESFRQGRHNVLLMDLKMPLMDGEQAFQAIREICTAEHLKMPAIIFCTGYAPPDTLDRILQENPNCCVLKKPVANQQLMDTIKARLNA